MKLNTQRTWITPLVMGTFVLMAGTGTLMFFHLDSGLNKVAHEWLGWAMVATVVLHVLLNSFAFKKHLANTTGRWVLGASVAVMALSFLPLGGSGGKPPFVGPMQALASAPLSTVAQVAGVSAPELRARLKTAGVPTATDSQTIQELVGADLGDQMRTLNQIMATSPAQSVGG
jgi:hypothetical protein